MNGKDHNLKCKCGTRPKFFCQTHKELICHREMGRHPCLLIPIEIFIKKLTPVELQQFASNSILDEEKNRLKSTFQLMITQKSSELKELTEKIEASFQKMIASFVTTWSNFVSQDIERHIEELQLSLLQYEKTTPMKAKKVSVSKNLPKELLSRNKDFQASLSNLIDQDYLFNSILGYFKCMESQAKTIESAVGSFVSLDLKKQDVIKQQLDLKIGYALLYESKDLIRKYFIDTEGDSISKFNALYLAYIDQGNEQTEGMRRISRRISNLNNLIPRASFNLRPRARASTLQQPRYSKAITEILGEIDFGDLEDTEMRNSNIDAKNITSFFKARTIHNESEDFDFEVDDTMIADVIKEAPEFNLGLKLQELVKAACQLMDHALFDFNCDGFFDPNFKGSVNVYLDKFLEQMSTNLVSLKNTFNKL